MWTEIPGFQGYYAKRDGALMAGPKTVSFLREGKWTTWSKGPRLLKPCMDARGKYWKVGMDGKSVEVHRAVGLAFLGPRPSPDHQIAHRDDNKNNNHADNLYWATRKQNAADALRNDKYLRGEHHGGAKLSNEQAIAVRCSSWTTKQLATYYQVSVSLIFKIRSGELRP